MRSLKHAVQIGLYDKAEYRFLPYPFHKEFRKIGEGHLLPLTLDLSGQWMYHGVECNPRHIKNFEDKKFEKYYQYAITDVDGESGVYQFPAKAKHENLYTVRSLLLESFFDIAGIEHCRFLAIDAEGWEYRILESYTHRIPIDFATIEYHPKYEDIYPFSRSRHDFESMLNAQGFCIEALLQTNKGEELQYFLQRDTS